jgi:hypothetical protein
MNPENWDIFSYESTQDKQRENAVEISKRKGKKGKERKCWENQNTIWQDKKRYS